MHLRTRVMTLVALILTSVLATAASASAQPIPGADALGPVVEILGPVGGLIGL